MYKFVDNMPTTRVKKNLNRDFSDGCYMAEITKYYLPPPHKNTIELHNYVSTNQQKVKRSNWQMLNRKVFSKLGKGSFIIDDDHIEKLITIQPGALETVLYELKKSIDLFT